MSLYTLPTMTKDGLVTDDKIIIESLFKYFITTQQSQSTIFQDNIISYDYILRTYKDDDLELRSQIMRGLTKLYKRYYPDVDIAIDIVNSSMYIDIKVTAVNGGTHVLSGNVTKNIIDEIDDITKLYF